MAAASPSPAASNRRFISASLGDDLRLQPPIRAVAIGRQFAPPRRGESTELAASGRAAAPLDNRRTPPRPAVLFPLHAVELVMAEGARAIAAHLAADGVE